MDRQSARIPTYRRRGYTRRRDDAVAHIVAKVLRLEGHEVAWEDRQGTAQPANAAWIARIGGSPAAIEVTRLLPPPYVRAAQNLVTHVEVGARAILRSATTGIGGQVVLALAFSTSGVTVRRRDRLSADTRALASSIRQTLNRLVSGTAPITISSPIPWILRAEVILIPGLRDGFHIVQSPDDVLPDLDAFVARTIAARPERPPGPAASAILAIDARFPDADDLRVAFGRSPVPVPWRRVYHVLDRAATLVYAADGQAPG